MSGWLPERSRELDGWWWRKTDMLCCASRPGGPWSSLLLVLAPLPPPAPPPMTRAGAQRHCRRAPRPINSGSGAVSALHRLARARHWPGPTLGGILARVDAQTTYARRARPMAARDAHQYARSRQVVPCSTPLVSSDLCEEEGRLSSKSSSPLRDSASDARAALEVPGGASPCHSHEPRALSAPSDRSPPFLSPSAHAMQLRIRAPLMPRCARDHDAHTAPSNPRRPATRFVGSRPCALAPGCVRSDSLALLRRTMFRAQ